jgi:hypothetical protein
VELHRRNLDSLGPHQAVPRPSNGNRCDDQGHSYVNGQDGWETQCAAGWTEGGWREGATRDVMGFLTLKVGR